MGKRKRGRDAHNLEQDQITYEKTPSKLINRNGSEKSEAADMQHGVSPDFVTVQIIVGTYEKVLHGVSAVIPMKTKARAHEPAQVEFADTFLFSAHSSAIRCLALSPSNLHSKHSKVLLASGGSDQTINLYQLALSPPSKQNPAPVSLTGLRTKSNSANRELGSLQHHGGGINKLDFPTRSKLISAAEDCTIAITRTRDWTTLSTIKTPMPHAHGRPSGDTAPLGSTPSGVNDFAIHPSMKLMISVSKGERCMRLWNLVSGKKAGVLNFEKAMLQSLGEGKWSTGEGRKVIWDSVGEEFVVAFEKGCVVYGLDSKAKCTLLPQPPSKVHQLRFLPLNDFMDEPQSVLAISTEDGRILFFRTQTSSETTNAILPQEEKPFAQMGGAAEGLIGRIKDFEILLIQGFNELLFFTGGSDGAIRIWSILTTDLSSLLSNEGHPPDKPTSNGVPDSDNLRVSQIGRLLGTYEAGNRITCLTAFLMVEPAHSGAESQPNDI